MLTQVLMMFPSLFASLKALKSSTSPMKAFDNIDNAISVPPSSSSSVDQHPSVNDTRQGIGMNGRPALLESLSTWNVTSYAEEFRMDSPLHTLTKHIEKQRVVVHLRHFVIFMGHEE